MTKITKRIRSPTVKPFSQEEVKKLGTAPDPEIARSINRPRHQIVLERKRLSIPSFKDQITIAQTDKWKRRKFPKFDNVSDIPAAEFYAVMAFFYKKKTGRVLTYSGLSKLTFWSHTRFEHWFTAGDAMQSLALSIRHHIFLTIKSELGLIA